MVTISPDIYREVAKELMRQVETLNFFNGTIEHDTEEYYSSLRCTLIISREKEKRIDGEGERITDIIPIWWEFSIYFSDGEAYNDFSWTELREYLPID